MSAEAERRRDPLMWLAVLRGLLDRPLASYYLLLAGSGLPLVIGLAMVFSATSVPAYAKGGNAYSVIAQQISAAVIGLAAFWICHRLPRRTFRAIAPTVVLVTLALLGTTFRLICGGGAGLKVSWRLALASSLPAASLKTIAAASVGSIVALASPGETLGAIAIGVGAYFLLRNHHKHSPD